MPFRFKDITGKIIWIGTNVFRVSGIKSGVVKRIRKLVGDKTIMFEDLQGFLQDKLAEDGLRETKQWLIDNNFTPQAINELLVYNPDTNQIHVRGELEDALAYEFFGVPKRVFPDVERLRGWVVNRVLTRDPTLREEYDAKTEKGKETMIKQLTYKFGRAIHKNGLKRQYTTAELDPHNPDRISVNWQGQEHEVARHIPGKKYRSSWWTEYGKVNFGRDWT